MKKVLFFMAFVLFSAYSYSQDLTINNNSAYDISVTASSATTSNCDEGFGAATVTAGTSGFIPENAGQEWMVVRVTTDPNLGFSVVAESKCSSSCGINLSNGLTLTWDVDCAEVTIDD